MRIIFLVPQFPTLSETFIVNKVLGLLAQGWDIHIVCGSTPPTYWKQFLSLNNRLDMRYRVHQHWPVRPRWLALALLPLALFWTFLCNPVGCGRYLLVGWRQVGVDVLRQFYFDARLIELRPQLVHIEFGSLATARMHLKSRLGIRLLISFRGYDLNYVGLDTPGYYNEVWRSSDAIHLLSNDLWERAQQRGCPISLPHVLIPPALDEALFTPEPRSQTRDVGTKERPLRIISVARLEWVKGYEYALHAVQLLIARGICCEYRIIGQGAHSESIVFARYQLGLDKVVTLMGALSPERVREQLNWADLMLHAAVSEGFCNAVLEAQAMGLPVVCSDAGGLPENVLNGVTGMVVPRRDPQAFAEALGRLAADGALRRRMSQAGRVRVLTEFRLEDQISAFEQIYRQLLEKV